MFGRSFVGRKFTPTAG